MLAGCVGAGLHGLHQGLRRRSWSLIMRCRTNTSLPSPHALPGSQKACAVPVRLKSGIIPASLCIRLTSPCLFRLLLYPFSLCKQATSTPASTVAVACSSPSPSLALSCLTVSYSDCAALNRRAYLEGIDGTLHRISRTINPITKDCTAVAARVGRVIQGQHSIAHRSIHADSPTCIHSAAHGLREDA